MEETYLDAFAFDDCLPPMPAMVVRSRGLQPSTVVQPPEVVQVPEGPKKVQVPRVVQISKEAQSSKVVHSPKGMENSSRRRMEKEGPPSSPSSVLLRISSNASELAGEHFGKGDTLVPKGLQRTQSRGAEMTQTGRKLVITLPSRSAVSASYLEVKTRSIGLDWLDVKFIMQDSTITGAMLDAKKLSSNPRCCFEFQGGNLEVDCLKDFSTHCAFKNTNLAGPKGTIALMNSLCSLESCTVLGRGLIVSSESKLEANSSKVLHSDGGGLVVTSGTTATLQDCVFEGTESKYGIMVSEGGQATVEKCIFTQSGVRSEGKEAIINIRDSQFDQADTSICACDGSRAIIERTKCSASLTNGIYATGRGTRLSVVSTEISEAGLHCLSIENGAHLQMENSKCQGSLSGCGLVADGPGASIKVKDCEFIDNRIGGVRLGTRASGVIQESGIAAPKGHGMIVEGYGTELTMLKTTVESKMQSAIVLKQEAFAKLKDVSSSGKNDAYALEIHGERTSAHILRGSYKAGSGSPILTADGGTVLKL